MCVRGSGLARLGRQGALLVAFAMLLSLFGAVPAVAKEPLRVVVLGDSYAAGNGAGNYWGPKGCYRSSTNWAARYVNTLKSQYQVVFTNRACSGAVFEDVRSRRSMDAVSRMAFAGGYAPDSPEAHQIAQAACPSPSYSEERYEATNIASSGFGEIVFECRRSLEAQWNAVDKSTDLVLLSIGGNDLHFATIVEQCFAPGVRDPHDCKDAIDFAKQHLGVVQAGIFSLLQDLKTRMRSGAKIVLVDYPYLEKNADLTLGRKILGIGTVYPVGREIRGLGDEGEQAQREAVDSANSEAGARVVYIDQIKGLFAGHEPDGRVTVANPDRWINEIADTRLTHEWYHYNPLGHEAIGALLAGDDTFGVAPLGATSGGAIDIAFLIDTTGSMGDSIDSAKAAATQLISEVQEQTSSARFAVIDYRDFPERTGYEYDYPALLDQDFTIDGSAAAAAIDGLSLGYGGDEPETMFSALNMAYGLSWRPGVKKMTVILTDARPLSPEPISGLTAEDIIQRSLEVDPVETHLVDVGFASTPEMEEIVKETNGGIYYGSGSTAAEAIGSAIEESLDRPFAWAAGPYVGSIGTTFEFDGSGSYGIGSDIVQWEWDFDADGVTDAASGSPTIKYAYPGAYEGLVLLRVTDEDGRTGLASAPVSVSADGDGIPDEVDDCPEEPNIGQEDWDEDGVGDACDSTPGIPTADLEGVFEGLEGENPTSSSPDESGLATGGASNSPPRALVAKDLKIGKPHLNRALTRLRLRVRCLEIASSCRGNLVVTVGRLGAVRARYDLAPAKAAILRLRLSPNITRRLATVRQVRVVVEVRSDAGVRMQRSASIHT